MANATLLYRKPTLEIAKDTPYLQGLTQSLYTNFHNYYYSWLLPHYPHPTPRLLLGGV